jgi:tetratricopeptide (TPR) repeat protein
MRDDYREALQVLADVFLEQNQPRKALALLEALEALDPGHPPVLRALSYAYLVNDRPDGALKTTDALLSLDAPMPENAPLLLIRSRALWALGRTEEATEILGRYLDMASPR